MNTVLHMFWIMLKPTFEIFIDCITRRKKLKILKKKKKMSYFTN